MNNKIKVKTSSFLNSVVNPLPMKRSPKGARGKILKETTLTQPNENQLLVESPLISKQIDIEGVWKDVVEVDSILLEKVVKALSENEFLYIWVDENKLIIKGKTQYSIPIL